MPMTIFDGDGKASAPLAAWNPTMTNYDNTEGVAQQQNQFEAIPEGDIDPLPTREEAGLGQLFRVKTPFEGLELVDEDTPTLIGAITEGDGSDKAGSGATDEEVREAIEAIEVW